MHGPVEVFSRSAAKSLVNGSQHCLEHFRRLCSGDCKWGEDMSVDQCMSRVLKIRRDNEFRLLVEQHCDPPMDWELCNDSSHVAFHPFKSPENYSACLDNARKAVR